MSDRDQRILAAYRWIDENITTLAHEPLPAAPHRVLHNPMEVQIQQRSDGTVLHPPLQPRKHKTRAQRMREQFKRQRPHLVVELIERDGRTCYACGEEIGLAKHGPNKLTVEHVKPLNAGGDNALANLRLAHSRCNR